MKSMTRTFVEEEIQHVHMYIVLMSCVRNSVEELVHCTFTLLNKELNKSRNIAGAVRCGFEFSSLDPNRISYMGK